MSAIDLRSFIPHAGRISAGRDADAIYSGIRRSGRAPNDPRLEIMAGGALAALFVIGFGGWSAVARLDAAVHAPGVVAVAGNRQSVQAMGGVVTAIHVHDGDHVAAGQLLIDFASVESLGQEASFASRVIALQAEIARLEAQLDGRSRIAAPAEWSALDPSRRAEAVRALDGEQATLTAKNNVLGAQRAVLGDRLSQVAAQIGGYDVRQASNVRQNRLIADELDGVRQLYAQGYATKTRVLSLERAGASIDGDIGSAAAEIGRLRASAGETRLQLLQLADQTAHDDAERLRTAQTEVASLMPQWRAARDQLDRQAARAPAAGTVMSIGSNTVGGVAARGQKLMDIVPDHAALDVLAQVAVGDANDLHAGQPADVRFPSLHGRRVAVLHGRVAHVSPDSMTDDHGGRPFYQATISIAPAALAAIGRDAGLSAGVRPGTPVEVSVRLRRRSALQYWIGPLTERFGSALSER